MHACLLTQGVQWGFLRELAIKRCTQVSSLVPLHACTWLHTLWLDGCHALARQELQDGEAGVLLALPSLQLVSLLGCRCAPGEGGSSVSSGPGGSSGGHTGAGGTAGAGSSGAPAGPQQPGSLLPLLRGRGVALLLDDESGDTAAAAEGAGDDSYLSLEDDLFDQ